jgi:hypothetical protein
MVAKVDIAARACVVFSLLREREHGTGDDELPVRSVRDGQACRSRSVEGVPAGGQGQSAGKTGSRTAGRTNPELAVAWINRCKTQYGSRKRRTVRCAGADR